MKEKKSQTLYCEDNGSCTSQHTPDYSARQNQVIEMYVFLDPLCPECWAMEPMMKKLRMEYGDFLRFHVVLTHDLESYNSPCGSHFRSLMKEMAQSYNETGCRTGMPCDGDVWYENDLDRTTPYTAVMAVKAAELQGRAVGSRYLRRLREALFMYKENIADDHVLINCAIRTEGMDVDEFVKDLHSPSTEKALSGDQCTAREMDITSTPTFVFFGMDTDEPGLKVEGLYPYHVYESILEDLHPEELNKRKPIPLLDFVQSYSIVATKEIAVVYDMSLEEAGREMRKLKLQQKVEEVPAKHGSFWRALHTSYENKSTTF
ncbi:ClpXP adapter SpxH family protein [Alkalicoccus urumqiensis]